jgi:GTPase SAR1 family protein
VYYTIYEDMDAMVVGKIVDGEKPNENIEAKSEMNDKHETLNTNSIKHDSKTHLIFGAIGCGKTTLFKQLIQEKLNRDEDVFVFGNEMYGRLYFNDRSNNKLHFYSPSDMSCFSKEVAPKDLAEYIVNFCYSVVGKDNTRTIAIDGFEQFELNPDYSTFEYFRELAKECRTKDINFLYTLAVGSDKKESYHKLPEIYERFSDIITVLK